MTSYRIVAKPDVSKTQILFSGAPDVLERLRAALPAGKTGEIAPSTDPSFSHSFYIYGHSLEMEKNLKSLLDKFIAEAGIAPPPAPAPPRRSTPSVPKVALAASGVTALLVVLSVVFFLNRPSPSAPQLIGSDVLRADQAGSPSRKRKKAVKNATTQVFTFEEPAAAAPALSLGELTVHMVDVEQGDAILIEFPSGKKMLIDAGEPKGKRNLIRYLESRDISRLDALVLTHPHLDHMAALSEILEKMEVGEVFEPAYEHATRTYQKFLEQVRDKGIEYTKAGAGSTIDMGSGVSVRVLSPPDPFLQGTRSDVNNSSVVIHVGHGKVSFLFTGDIEAEVENLLVDEGGIEATILKAPHHGGAHSSQMRFLEAVSPEVVLISCGEGNSYGHPAPGSLLRYRKVGARIYRTDHLGSIRVISNGREFRVEPQQGGEST